MTLNPINLGSALLDRDDPQFAAACASWNARIQHHPDAVVAATSADEVAAAVRYAAENNMRVRVQSTGHGATAAEVGGMLLRTVGMRDVTIDPATGLATIQAGAQWKDVVSAAYGLGYAPPCGTSSDVGSLGFTLGGGANWFVRKYGLACDMMRAAQIVTADGNLRWVDETNEPDLFWAVRGGGPNFGVVTAMQMQLAPFPEVYAGHLIWPVERFTDVMTAWRDWVARMPEEITSTALVLHAPDAPFVPEPIRGQSFVIVLVCYAGDDATGIKLTEPLRGVPGMVLDELGHMPFLNVDAIAQDPVDPLPHLLWSTMIGQLDDATIASMAQIAPRGVEPYIILEARHVGGGLRPEPDRLGLAHWSGDFILSSIAVTPTPDAYAAAVVMGAQHDAMFANVSTGMTPLNFLDSPEAVSRAYTPAHLARMLTIKQAYDPTGMFGADRAIVPIG
jgi:FAD/FMN-containing dehydrogenase